MSVALEYKKMKRTGFLPAFLGGGLAAAALPVLNMLARSEMYINQPGQPLDILLDANWQMMAMLNAFLIVIGACILYHTEFADNAMQKMETLPVSIGHIFIGKCILLLFGLAIVFVLETAALAFCSAYWFAPSDGLITELLQNMGYMAALTLPTLLLMMAIASACTNLWISLGIGVICMFASITITTAGDNFFLSILPFALPCQTLAATEAGRIIPYLCAAGVQLALFGAAECAYCKIRGRLR